MYISPENRKVRHKKSKSWPKNSIACCKLCKFKGNCEYRCEELFEVKCSNDCVSGKCSSFMSDIGDYQQSLKFG